MTYTAKYDSNDSGDGNNAFRHLRGGSRKKNPGCLMFWGRLAWGQRLMLGFLIFGFCGVWSGLGYMFLPRAAAAEAPPAVVTIAPLPSPIPVEQPPVGAPTVTPTTPLEPIQIAATATFQAAINKPAFMNNPAAAPSFVGVITYEDGCRLSNIGFTTSGYNGKPYYLYVRQQFDRNPLYQMAQVSGFIQQFPDDCQYPVIMVETITWFDSQATPSPLAITKTVAITDVWGMVSTTKQITRPTVSVYVPHPEYLTPVPIAAAPTATVTWTSSNWSPQPWSTPNYGPQLSNLQSQINDLQGDIDAYKATKTATPSPTPTLTPTPAVANIAGGVINVSGCANTNLAIQISAGNQVLLILSGAALPGGQPAEYTAVASGTLGRVCNQTVLYATAVSWYLPTATPTPTPTSTSTPTATPTATNTPEPTVTATEIATTQPEAQ